MGIWTDKVLPSNNDTGLHIFEHVEEDVVHEEILRLSTGINAPYVMEKLTVKNLTGNDKYEGYCIDLMNELAKIVGFKYILMVRNDTNYGKKVEGKWVGIIGQMLANETDMGIADFTITKVREEAVDFTLPFMNTGISLLYKKPTSKDTKLFSFLDPFSMEVWALLIAITIVVTVIFCIAGRLSPYEWDNPHPCRQDDQVMENECSLKNSFWFTVGSLMQQGSDLAPK